MPFQGFLYGKLADRYHTLMESYNLQQVLVEASVDDTIIELFSLDRDYVITASTDKEAIDLLERCAGS